MIIISTEHIVNSTITVRKMELPEARASPGRKRTIIDFKKNDYDNQRKDLIENGAHNYINKVVGSPEEIEYCYKLMKQELNQLVEIGVLAPAQGATEWALPTFIIPKKPSPSV